MWREDIGVVGKQNRRRRTGRKAAGVAVNLDEVVGDPRRLAEAIVTVAAQGDTRQFVAGLAEAGPEVAEGVAVASRRLIAHAFESGWLPADVHEAARRRVDEFAVGFLIDAMAAHRAGHADDTWQRQLDDLSATVWWHPDRPHLPQWADRALLTDREALTAALDALSLLVRLPKLAALGPARPPRSGVDDKTLGRIRGLLAKAESTAYPAEAETLSAKAQELMTKYAIDHVLLAPTPGELPGARRIWLDTPYTEAKALLVDLVARANRSRAVFVADWDFVTVVGEDSDLDAVEILSTSLLVQATRTMIDNAPTDESRSRHYRKAFLTAYATRIGERLAAAAEATIADSPDPGQLLPALATHQQRVDHAVDNYFPTTRSRGITIRSAEGWTAGTDAADRAHVDNP